MSRSLSSDAKRAILSQNTGDVFLWLLEISHASFAATYYFVNSAENVTSNSQIYTAYPFEINIPTDDGETVTDIELKISNVEREIINELRTIATPIDISASVVRAEAPDVIEVGPFEMKLRDTKYNALNVIGTLKWEDILNESACDFTFTPGGFPGLF